MKNKNIRKLLMNWASQYSWWSPRSSLFIKLDKRIT